MDTFGLPPAGTPSLEDVQLQLDAQARTLVPVLQSIMGQMDTAGKDLISRQQKVVNRIQNSITGSLRRQNSVIAQVGGEIAKPVFTGMDTGQQKIAGAMSDPEMAAFIGQQPMSPSFILPPAPQPALPPTAAPLPTGGGGTDQMQRSLGAGGSISVTSPMQPGPPAPPPPLPPSPPSPPLPLTPPPATLGTSGGGIAATTAGGGVVTATGAGFPSGAGKPPCPGAKGPFAGPPPISTYLLQSGWTVQRDLIGQYWLCPPMPGSPPPPLPPSPPSPPGSPPDLSQCPQSYTIIKGPPCPTFLAILGTPDQWLAAGFQLPPGYSVLSVMTDTPDAVQSHVNALIQICVNATVPTVPPAKQAG